MKTIKSIFICLLAFSLYACKHGDANVKQFPASTTLTPTLISINEIIKIGGIYKLDDYIVLHNVDNNAQYFFYVYSFPEFKFLYSFGQRGNGPEEYLMPSIIKNTPDNTFSFRDHATDKFVTYQLLDSTAIQTDKYHFKPDETHFFWEMNYISDHKYLLKRSNSEFSARELWDLSSKKKLCDLPNTFDLPQKMGKDYSTEYDDVWISSFANRMTFAYFFIDRIEIGNIEKDKLSINTHIGKDKAPDFYLFKESETGGKYQYNIDYNIVYYEFLTCTDKYIYALYAGIPWGDLENKHSSIIEVYNWQGKLVKLLNLQQSLSSFVVDEDKEVLYGINADTKEDAILEYILD